MCPFTEHTNPLGQVQRTYANALGQTLEQTHSGDNATTTFAYDALGQLLWTDGPLPGIQDRITIGYDELGHKAWLDDPDMGEWQYYHNAFGELVCQMDANGNGVYSEYDELGRLVQRHDRSNVSNLSTCAGTAISISKWVYGTLSDQPDFGQLISDETEVTGHDGSASSTVRRTFIYDALGRPEETITDIDEGPGSLSQIYEQTTTYDQYGRIFQEFGASGENYGSRMVYGDYGHLQAIREARDGAPESGWEPRVYWKVEAMDALGNVIQRIGSINALFPVIQEYPRPARGRF